MSRDVRDSRRTLPAAGVAVPADRRFRRADALPVRRRRAGRTLWTLARATAVVVGVALIGTWGGQEILASDMFRVRDITVRGNTRLSVGTIESLLAGLRDENVFLVDFERYRRQVMDSTWIEQVTLSRVLPATIVVDIVERTPMAIARLNQQLYLVDRTGTIVDDYHAEHHGLDLPIVDGLLQAPEDGDGALDPERVGVAARLLDDVATIRHLQQRLSQIDVTNPRDVVVMLDDDAAWLHLGEASFADRLQRYLDLRPALVDRFGSIDYADLKFDERVYVRGQGRRTPGSAAAE